MYALAPIAVVTLRRTYPDRERTYRMPYAKFWAPAAFVLADLIVYWSGFPVTGASGWPSSSRLLMLVGRRRLPSPSRRKRSSGGRWPGFRSGSAG